MRVGIMQPYFFPYLGYYSLIKNVDKFILFDTPQFIRHGWIERNKVCKQDGGTFYIKVPLIKHSRDTSINNILINNDLKWKERMFAQLTQYKRKAPFYEKVIQLLEKVFDSDTESITLLNQKALMETCDYLDIQTPIQILSDMSIAIPNACSPDEWALEICKKLGAKDYINPEGGLDFFDKEKYDSSMINLKFLRFTPTPYRQFNFSFVSNLSIIDTMMFNEPSHIKHMLDHFELI